MENLDSRRKLYWEKRYARFCNRHFSNEYDFIIFITRKCYHYTVALRRYGTCKIEFPPSYKVLRDRDLLKEMDFSMLVGKRVLLIDDTVINGGTLADIYNLLNEKIKGNITIDMAAFAVSCDFINRTKETPIRNAAFDQILSGIEISEFILHEMQFIHDGMGAYVIDLPVMNKLTISPNILEGIKNNKDSDWEYHDCRFSIGKKEYDNGILIYRNPYLEKKFSKILLNFVIKFRYQENENNEIDCGFTPFAMLTSTSYEEMKICFMELFSGTDYAEMIGEKCYENCEDYVTLYRGVVYQLSYYIGRLFAEYLENQWGVRWSDQNLYQENSLRHISPAFDRAMEEIFNLEKSSRYTNRLGGIHCFENEGWSGRVCTTGAANTSYEAVEHFTVEYIAAEKLKAVKARAKEEIVKREIALEDLATVILDKFEFSSVYQFKEFLTRIIIKLLDQSSLSNMLSVCSTLEGSIIKRGFRLGEFSDIYITPNIEIFFAGIYAYSCKMRLIQSYHEHYQEFIQRFYRFLLEEQYFEHSYISVDEFNFCSKFYDSLDEYELFKELENKRVLLQSDIRNEKDYIVAIFDFVQKLYFY